MNSAGIKYSIQLTHINDIRAGDVVEINGVLKTVSKANLARCSFMGVTLFGDSYRAGNIPVRKAIIFHARP